MTYSPYGQPLSDEEERARFAQRNAEMAEYEAARKYAEEQQNAIKNAQAEMDGEGQGEEQPTGEEPAPEQPQEQEQPQQPQEQEQEPQRNSRGQVIGEPIGDPIQIPGGANGMGGVGPTGMMPMPTMTKEQGTAIAETVLAPATGTIDGLVDMYNWIAPDAIDIPEIPKFKNQDVQVVREVSSFIGPNLLGIGLLGNTFKAIHGANKIKLLQALGNNRAFQWFANRGLEAGVGAAVDQTSRHSEDHNFLGHVAKWTNTEEGAKIFGIFGPDLYTMDSDSPDLKRSKNRNEGILMGWASSLLEAAGSIGIGGVKTYAATRWIPKDEEAIKYFDRIKADEFAGIKYSDNVVEDTILRSQARQEKALDELGNYFFVKEAEAQLDQGLPIRDVDSIEFQEPVKGIHDMFDFAEGGVRTVDPGGVPAAMVDAARIRNNIGTRFGRVGSMITEAALRYGMNDGIATKRSVVGKIKEQILGSSKFDAVVNGKVLSDVEIDEAGTELAEILMGLDPGEMRLILAPFKKNSDELGSMILNKVGYDATFKALKAYQGVYADLAEKKAAGLLTTSLAGQASDMASEIRVMDGTAAGEQLMPAILNRMEYLMVEKGLASYDAGRVLQSMNVWDRMKRINNPQQLVKDAQLAREKHIGQIVDQAKSFTHQLLKIGEEKPNFLAPLVELWAYSDGKISSMYSMNKYVYENLGAVTQAFVRGEDTLPNLIVQGMWSNYFNSILSATTTPIRALVGNTTGLIARPINSMAGMVLSGEFGPQAAHRTFTQYAGFTQAFSNALQHFSFAWKKSVENPHSMMDYGKADLVVKHEEHLGALEMFADASMKEGNDGPAIMLEHAKSIQSLADSPWMRYSANAMTAYDAFTRAFIATAEARGRAFDQLTEMGKPISRKKMKEISKQVYSDMVDENGFITDKAVGFYSGEIALNLDSPMANALGELVRHYPVARPFFMFPRTQANALAMVRKYGPLELFTKEFSDFAIGPSADKVPMEHIQRVLTNRGIPVDANALQTFKQMRYETKGRMAIGTLSTIGAGIAFMNGNITGDGHYDPRRQRLLRDIEKPTRMYKGVDGKWHSYEWLGPLADWIATTVNIMDNAHTLSSGDMEMLLNKAQFVLANAFFNKSVFSMFEPLNDVLNGNGNAIARLSARQFNSLVPLGSLRNQFSKLMTDGLKEVDDDLMSLLRNQNNWLDALDGEGLAPKHDWVDGGIVGDNYENFWHKTFDQLRGYKTSPELSARKKFLAEIEYDATPSMQRDDDGNDLPDDLRSAIYYEIGKQGHFKYKLDQIMKDAATENFVGRLRYFRRHGVGTDPRKGVRAEEYQNLYNRIDDALREAKTNAIGRLRHSDPGAWAEIDSIRRSQNENTSESRAGSFILKNK